MNAHNAVVRREFDLQARPFTRARHATDENLMRRYVEAIGPGPSELVADVGAGPGLVAAALAPLCRRVVCVDLTHNMLIEARRLAPRSLAAEGAGELLPLRSASCDVAISRLAFHHFWNPTAVFDEMVRVVKPGGRIVINDLISSEDAAEAEMTERIEKLRDPSHARCLRPSEIESLFLTRGIAIERSERYESLLDHDEWMGRVFPPEENRPVVRRLLEESIGRDLVGIRVYNEGEMLMIEHRGRIVVGRKS